jgi:hypothetical protein
MVIRREFDSVESLLEAANGKSDTTCRRASRDTSLDKWSGYASFEQACKLARDGWPEGLKRLNGFQERIQSFIGNRTNKPLPEFDVTGQVLDIGLLLSGVPECFISLPDEPKEGRGKIIDIVFSSSYSSGVDSEEIFWRGAALVALIDVLESRGLSCSVVSDSTVTRGYGNRYTARTTVKALGDVLDLDRIAFCACHAGFFRRVIFSLEETESDEVRHTFGFNYGGYGCPADPEPVSSEAIAQCIHLDSKAQVSDQESASAWVLENFAKFVELEPAQEGI